MRPARNQTKVRLNIDMPLPVKEKLEDLRDQTGAESMSEVMRRALAVYDFLLTQKAEGAITVIRSKDGAEALLPLFEQKRND